MLSSMTNMTFDQFLSAVQAKAARRKNQERQARPVADDPRPAACYPSRLNDLRGRGIGHSISYRGRLYFKAGTNRGKGRDSRTTRQNGFFANVCHYCGMLGHFIRFCRTIIANEGDEKTQRTPNTRKKRPS